MNKKIIIKFVRITLMSLILTTALSVGSAKAEQVPTKTIIKGNSISNKVASVSLNKTKYNIRVGQTYTLLATVNPTKAKNKTVKWTSSNPRIAKVDAKGKITAVSPGAATIRVTTIDGSKTASCIVTVNANSIIGTIVTKYKYKLGESYQLFTEPTVSSKIKELLGNDYNTFKECMYSISSDIKYDNVNKTYTINGGMPGLFTIMEGIVQLDENGNIKLAFSYINDSNIGVVKYYTTEKGQTSIVMPKEIKNWINDNFPKNIVIHNDGVKIDINSIAGYYTNTQFKSDLDIKLNDNHITFVGNASWGTHVGYVEGTAEIINGRYAIYEDDFGILKFTFYNDKVEVDEIGSFGGMNVTFAGIYRKNSK